jgi:hypothetical protein
MTNAALATQRHLAYIRDLDSKVLSRDLFFIPYNVLFIPYKTV